MNRSDSDSDPDPDSSARLAAVTPAAAPAQSGSGKATRPSCNSRVLFAGGTELVIFHYGEPYCLRETRQGKLILTK
jgi:hemin uptake protein HemP